jgi:hypothetical protein
MYLKIEDKDYSLIEEEGAKFVAPGASVCFCDQLAEDYKPVILDPRGYGSSPTPPSFMAYRSVIDPEKTSLCLQYEVYWKRQDCTWRELNKDHDHDYEQIQLHFDLENGLFEKVAVSSVGPLECAGHGVEVYSQMADPEASMIDYVTSEKEAFPWGGGNGRKCFTQVREMPLEKLVFTGKRPVVQVINCYHVFTGWKKERPPPQTPEMEIPLKRLDRTLLDRWYYHHATNRFGHDVSKPYEEPYLMYYPPPEDFLSRIVYEILWMLTSLK